MEERTLKTVPNLTGSRPGCSHLLITRGDAELPNRALARRAA